MDYYCGMPSNTIKYDCCALYIYCKNSLCCNTRHSSKGLEFEVIVMTGIEDEVFRNLIKEMLDREKDGHILYCKSKYDKNREIWTTEY